MHTSIETTAVMGRDRHLILDEEIPVRESEKVRVIVLLEDDLEESLWTNAGTSNSVFDLLADESEDIYSPKDGTPIVDEA